MTTTRHRGATIEHEIGPRGELTLRVETGDVAVVATSEGLVRIRDLDGEDLEGRFAIERADGGLAIRPREGLTLDLAFARRGPARLAIDVPRDATVSLDTASADLRVAGLAGDQRYRTASGTIELVDASGQIGVDAVSGDVRIDARAPVDLSGRLVSGDLRLRGGVLRSVAVGTTSGDVELDAPLVGPGPYSVQTVSGDALVVAGRDGLRVEARTVTGEITADAAHRSESATGQRILLVGAGGPTLAFRSISGDLRILAASTSAVAGPRPVPAPERVDGVEADRGVPSEPPSGPVGAGTPSAPGGGPASESVSAGRSSAADPVDDARLGILRDLESGSIDVHTATERLAALEDGSDG